MKKILFYLFLQTACFAGTSDISTYARVGDNSGVLTPNKVRFSALYIDRPGVPLTGRVFVDSSRSIQPIKMALYTDEFNSPARLLAETWDYNIPQNAGSFWAEMEFVNRPLMVRGQYWVGVLAGNSFEPARYRFYTQFPGTRIITSNDYRDGFYPIYQWFEEILQGTLSAAIYYRPIKEGGDGTSPQ